MKIFITGTAGFVGSHLAARLCQRGEDVVGFVRNRASMSPLSASRLASLEAFKNFRWLDGNSVSEISAGHPRPFDACIHLAGRSSVRESLQNPGLYEDDNCRFSMWLLELMRKANCPRVIHASTVMVYGKDAPVPYHEDGLGSTPASFYGASKLAIETQMNTWRALHKMETINLRLFSVYGPGLRPDCVPHLIATAIKEQREFNVYGDGSSVRDYVGIEDVVDAFEAALTVPWRGDFPLALNIGSGVGTSLIELIRMLESALNSKMRIQFKPAVTGELHKIVADIRRAEEVLGWKPRVKIADGIAGLGEWFLSSEF